jgi:hypothetical protein
VVGIAVGLVGGEALSIDASLIKPGIDPVFAYDAKDLIDNRAAYVTAAVRSVAASRK